MTTYVALLRGINVGGNNRVEMARLRKLFSDMGYERVETYINSGNIIFDSSKPPVDAVIMKNIEKEFGFPVRCVVLEGKAVVRIAKALPAEWVNNATERKSDVLYLFEESDRAATLKEIGHNPDIETFQYVDGAIITTILRKHQTKSSLIKIVGTDLYKTMTIRNVTTARKLAHIVSEREKHK